MKKLLFTAAVILGFTAISFGQKVVNTTATAKVNITEAQSVSKAFDMDFGSVAQSGLPGTVVLDPATGSVSSPEGLVLTGSSKAAEFTLTGTAANHYTYTIPNAAITATGAGVDMTIDTWTSPAVGGFPAAVAGAGEGVLVNSIGALKIGATLHVNASQAVGLYVTQPFNVTVTLD